MDNAEQTLEYVHQAEMRFESACQKKGWIASAALMVGSENVSLQLEKFSTKPVTAKDRESALKSLKLFACTEFDILGTDLDPLLKTDEEKIPKTRAPYHVTFEVELPVPELKRAAS